MKGSSRALVFWLTLGVLLPAVLSYSLHKVLSRHHGLVISVGQQTYRYANVEEAAAFLIQNRFEDRSQLKTTVWVPPEGQFYIFLKGIHREVYVDTKKVPALSAFVPCIARDPLGAGLHDVVIQFKKIPPNSTFEFLWSKDYAEPQPIPPDCLYVTSPPALVLYGSLIASLLAILARLNCILILLVAPAVLLYRRLAPPLPMGVALWILFALMLLIRLNGIGYQLNEGIHPDERAVENRAQSYRMGNWKPENYFYPPGFHYMTAGVEILMKWIVGIEPPDHLGPRLLSVLFSWLSCLVVVSIGGLFLSRAGAMAAGVLMGFSYMPVNLAHFGIIEPAMVFFFLLSLRLLFTMNNESKWKDFLIAGVVSGLAVAVKQTAAIIVIPFLSIYLFVYRKKVFQLTNLQNAFWWGGAVLFTYLIIAPFTILDYSGFLRDQVYQAKFFSGHTHEVLFFTGETSGFLRILSYLEDGVGYPLLAVAALGSVLLARVSGKAFVAIVPLSVIFFALACKAVAAPYHHPLLLCPFLALLAATVIQYVAARTGFSREIVLLSTLLLLLPSLPRIAKLEKLLVRTDTRKMAAEWCYQNLHCGVGIDADFFGPHLLVPSFFRRITPLIARGTWHQYEIQMPTYYMMDSLSYEVASVERDWYTELQKNADLVHEFNGEELGLYNPHIFIYKFRKADNDEQ